MFEISKHSKFDEEEILFAPHSVFKVIDFVKDLKMRSFLIKLQPVPYKMLISDPNKDLPIYVLDKLIEKE